MPKSKNSKFKTLRAVSRTFVGVVCQMQNKIQLKELKVKKDISRSDTGAVVSLEVAHSSELDRGAGVQR